MLAALATPDGISPDALAALLKTSKREIGGTLGISAESLSRGARVSSAKVQTQLRQLAEILNLVAGRFGNPMLAYAWYRSEPLTGFAGRTPEEVVKAGNFDGLKAHILRRLDGGYA